MLLDPFFNPVLDPNGILITDLNGENLAGEEAPTADFHQQLLLETHNVQCALEGITDAAIISLPILVSKHLRDEKELVDDMAVHAQHLRAKNIEQQLLKDFG